MTGPVRIAAWSGPRNISTAMMRAFEARGDCAVIDEPFYAAYLAATGLDHPLRDAVLASQPTDPAEVVRRLDAREARPLAYEKHMAQHMLGGFPLDWMARRRNLFLIRAPERVLASYVRARAEAEAADLGFARQAELFDREADRLGRAAPVLDAEDVLADPPAMLAALCAALAIPFTSAMLAWSPGPRSTDGVWAPAWYAAVERSAGFAPPSPAPPRLPDRLRAIANAARPHYERLRAWRLQPSAA